jgi:hypothetical protein
MAEYSPDGYRSGRLESVARFPEHLLMVAEVVAPWCWSWAMTKDVFRIDASPRVTKPEAPDHGGVAMKPRAHQ